MTTATESIYYNDSDRAQVELLPVRNWTHCHEEVDAMSAFQETRRDGEPGTGFHVRRGPPHPIADLHISMDELDACVPERFTRIRRVVSDPMPPRYTRDRERTLAYRVEGCVLFAEHDVTRRLEAAWFDLFAVPPIEVEAILQLFAAVEKRWPLMLVDWRLGMILNVSEPAPLRSYLESLVAAGE